MQPTAVQPDVSQRRNDFEAIWRNALKQARETLGEDDFEYVQDFTNAEQLLAEVQSLEKKCLSTKVPRMLISVKPHLGHLQYFATYLTAIIGSSLIRTACVWGATSLLLRLASPNDDATERITQYLIEFGERLRVFETLSKSVQLEPEDLNNFFDILVQLLLDSVNTIKYFRKNDGPSVFTSHKWVAIQASLDKSLERLSRRLGHLKELAQAQALAQEEAERRVLSDRLEKLEAVPRITLRKYILPPRNTVFSGRNPLLDQVENAMKSQDPSTGIQSVALWGTGGIGKSQTAMEFAHRQKNDGCPIIIWVPSESESEMSKTFSDAAASIQPPGYSKGAGPEEMRQCMLDWLQTFDQGEPWLLIFDNVEDNELLRRWYPSVGRGKILITCRSEIEASSPAAFKIEVPVFGKADGGQVLLTIAGKKNSDPNELQAAEEIVDALGGLALGIDIVARHLFVSKKSTKDFLPRFLAQQNSTMRLPPRYAQKNPYYSKTLVNVWERAFGDLSPNSALLLGILCMIAPDGIPRDIFSPDLALLEPWTFLSDITDYEEAEQQLLYESLVKIDEETEILSIHRLTQEAFFYFMDDKQRLQAFDAAWQILAHAFPKRDLGRMMFDQWRTCQQLIRHVDVLSAKSVELRSIGLDVQEPAWAILLSDAAWFCGESDLLLLGANLMNRIVHYWSDTNSLEFAYIHESLATVAHKRGRYFEALKSFKEALRIRSMRADTPPTVIADSHSAVGLALLGLFRNDEAIESVEKARQIVLSRPEEERAFYNYDRYLRNLARPKVALKQYGAAISDLDEAERFQTAVYGVDCRFNGETAYIRAGIAAEHGDFDIAIGLYERAYELIAKTEPFDQQAASIRYHQGLLCMKQRGPLEQRQEKALTFLNEALRVCRAKEKNRGDGGESARVEWHIAKVWQSQGFLNKAAAYEAEAMKVKLQLEETGAYPSAPDENSSWDCFCDLVAR